MIGSILGIMGLMDVFNEAINDEREIRIGGKRGIYLLRINQNIQKPLF